MLEATEESIRLLSEVTSDAIVDTLSATRSVLEELYKSGAGEFSQEELRRDLATYQQVSERSVSVSDLKKRLELLTADAQALRELMKKYSDSLPISIVNSSKFLEKKVEGLEEVLNALMSILDAVENENPKSILKVYSGLITLSEALEQYIFYFSKQGKLIGTLRALATEMLASSILALKKFNVQGQELGNYLIAIKSATRSILWQIDNYEKKGKFPIKDLIDWLDTSPGWAGDDFDECLEQFNRERQ